MDWGKRMRRVNLKQETLRMRHTVGVNLRSKRQARGWTQEMLEKKARVPQTTISYYENAVTSPSLEHLTSLAKALQCKVSEFFMDSSTPLLAGDPPKQKRGADARER